MTENGPSAALQAAMEALNREERSTRARSGLTAGLWTLALVLVILGVGWLTSRHPLGLFPLYLALLCILSTALASPRRQSRALDALAPIADAHTIGPLLDLLPGAFAGRRQAMRALLTQLLPQLHPLDAGLLEPSHRRQLRNALILGNFEKEREYQIAILKALEQIGNREDLVVVERLAGGSSDSWQERQVRDAARACLPRLREQAEQQRHRGILLRPAFAVAPEELLHPAIHESDPDPSQLLRPERTRQDEPPS